MATADEFKAALGSWASGVTVVTTRAGDLAYGLTVSSFASLSLDPQLILVSINNDSRFLPLAKKSRKFAVSILAREQEETSIFFAENGRDPSPDFGDIASFDTSLKVPVLRGSLAYLTCTIHTWLDQSDHTILLGAVQEASTDESKKPLMYFRRGYCSIGV